LIGSTNSVIFLIAALKVPSLPKKIEASTLTSWFAFQKKDGHQILRNVHARIDKSKYTNFIKGDIVNVENIETAR
jgi:translation initiation factor IF-1